MNILLIGDTAATVALGAVLGAAGVRTAHYARAEQVPHGQPLDTGDYHWALVESSADATERSRVLLAVRASGIHCPVTLLDHPCEPGAHPAFADEAFATGRMGPKTPPMVRGSRRRPRAKHRPAAAAAPDAFVFSFHAPCKP